MGTPLKWATAAVRITGLAAAGAWATGRARTEIRALNVAPWQQVAVAATVGAVTAYAVTRHPAHAIRRP